MRWIVSMMLLLTLAGTAQQVLPAMGSVGSSPSGGGATFVQAQTCNGSATTTCTTTAMTVTLGNTLGLCAASNTAVATFTPSASNGTDTFTQSWTTSGNGMRGTCWYVLSTTSSGSTTFTVTSTNSGVINLKVVEVTGVTGLDTAGTGTNAATNTLISCPNLTTTNNNAIVFCYGGLNSSTTSWTGSSGMTIPTNGSNTATGAGAIEYQQGVTPAGTVISGTFTSGTSRTSASGTLAFH